MPAMPSATLTESKERILLVLWKLRGIGNNPIREDSLKAEAGQGDENLENEMIELQMQGFLERVTTDDHKSVSLTPLGLAILRQIEEDKLQELK
jgi:predicted transcriptional regulator